MKELFNIIDHWNFKSQGGITKKKLIETFSSSLPKETSNGKWKVKRIKLRP